MRRHANRKDANHGTIARAFEQLGAGVFDTAQYGMPLDLLVFWRGRILLVEIKDGDKPPSRRKLTADEAGLHALAARYGIQIHTVERETQAFALLGGRIGA